MEVVLALSDAKVRQYTRTFDGLAIQLALWNDEERTLWADGVTHLRDDGTYECDALVRVPELDRSSGDLGYGIVDIEGNVTLTFRARTVRLDPAAGTPVGGHS